MTKYFVTAEVECTECKGNGYVTHWQWQQFWAEHQDQTVSGDELDRWFLEKNGRDKYGMTIIPEEEHECPECEGMTKFTRQVELSEALADILRAAK